MNKPEPKISIDGRELVIGQYANYFDTGMWTFQQGAYVAPDSLTIEQLRDHLTAWGGFVCLRQDGKIVWFNRLGDQVEA